MLEDVNCSCCNSRVAVALILLWLFILSIVCISLGSQIGMYVRNYLNEE